jgi:LacI family transcriptional regulator
MNDVIALGVYDYAFTQNIKIPEQLAVVGFDNQVISTVLNPRLTTVALPLTEIGNESVLLMEKLINDRKYVCDPNIISMSCKIIYRDSV